ncbi:MAG: glycosyltransferase [Acidobacteriota bacterium]|nr:glycosyltransferase [Acidobacteriota bacterium]
MIFAPLPAKVVVSVLIASYNYARFVAEAIESVLTQTYPYVEVIVCDDESTDGSPIVIERLAQHDARVKLICQPHAGAVVATNRAYAVSRGEIICLLDADDRFAPTKIEMIVRHFAEYPDSGLAVHPMMLIDKDGQEIRQIPFLTQFETGWIAERVIRRGGRWRYMPTSALCLRRELVERLFPVPETASFSDGYIYTLGPLLAPVSHLADVLTHYRVHGTNASEHGRSAAQAQKAVNWRVSFIESVNARLVALGLADHMLDIRRNLEFVEQTFAYSLYQGKSYRTLLKEYGAFARALATDDLYHLPQKCAGLVVYGIALLLPVRARSGWLTNVFEHNGARPYIKAIMTRRTRVRSTV